MLQEDAKKNGYISNVFRSEEIKDKYTPHLSTTLVSATSSSLWPVLYSKAAGAAEAPIVPPTKPARAVTNINHIHRPN